MEILWILLIVLFLAVVWRMFFQGVGSRTETVVRERPRRRRRVIERETIEPDPAGGERRVVEREVPDDRI